MSVMTFQDWQEHERELLKQRIQQQLTATGKRKLNTVQQGLVNARLDCIREGKAEYERVIATQASEEPHPCSPSPN